MLALRTFKGPQIGMSRTRFDPGQHHAALTLRAAWPFGRKQGWLGLTKGFGHVMILLIRREHAALSVTDGCRKRDGDSLILIHDMSGSRLNSDLGTHDSELGPCGLKYGQYPFGVLAEIGHSQIQNRPL